MRSKICMMTHIPETGDCRKMDDSIYGAVFCSVCHEYYDSSSPKVGQFSVVSANSIAYPADEARSPLPYRIMCRPPRVVYDVLQPHVNTSSSHSPHRDTQCLSPLLLRNWHNIINSAARIFAGIDLGHFPNNGFYTFYKLGCLDFSSWLISRPHFWISVRPTR